MKKLICNIGNWSFTLITIVLLSISCDKDDDMQENPDSPNNPQVQLADPNKATASLIFDNMNVINGSPPTTKNNTKSSIDLKIDSDTIFWTPGVIKRLKILKPIDISLSFGVWIYVPGASSYIQTTLREEEETDEIGILYFDFKHSNWEELPITFPLRIIPLDEDGSPTDEFLVPVVIEEPYTSEDSGNGGGGCNIDLKTTIWEWIYFKQESPAFFTAPMYPHITPGTTLGCCIDGESDANAQCANSSNEKQLDYEIVFMRPLLNMVFTGEGPGNDGVLLSWEVFARNFDPFTSNFCSNTAGYTENISKGNVSLDYTINPDCSISFDFSADNNSTYMGGGPSIKYNLISDHFMKQTITGSGGADGGSGGAGLTNMFEKRNWNSIDVAEWFD